jgi:heme-degrading monooxygenase HmoA
VVRHGQETAYLAELEEQTFPEIRKIEGFAGSSVLKRSVADGTEFLVATRWMSMESIARFAGDDTGSAVVPPEVREMMVEFDARVSHYEEVKA